MAAGGGCCGWRRGEAKGGGDRLPESVSSGTAGSRPHEGAVAAGRGRSGAGVAGAWSRTGRSSQGSRTTA